MEWIHCNRCCRQPRSNDKDFIMTSCGHILCRRCENRENVDSCAVCERKCRITSLSDSLKPEIKMYFDDIETKLNDLTKIVRFQQDHRRNFAKKQARIVESCRSVKTENDLLRKKLLDAENKVQSLEEQMRHRYVQKTPASRNHSNVPRPRQYPHFSDPRTPARDVFESTHKAFQRIQPHLRKYNNYRAADTPTGVNTSIPSDASTGFARSFHRQMGASPFVRPRDTLQVPAISRIRGQAIESTPPYNALRGMNIDELRRKRDRAHQ